MADLAGEINATLTPALFVLSPGDALDIRFPNRAEWNQVITIRPDGRATFPFLAELHVAGSTVSQLDERLTRAYTPILQDPEVMVNVTTIAARHVFVIGEVHEPGQIEINGNRLSLIEALGKAGGPLKETALLSNTLLVRWSPKDNRQIAWCIDADVDKWGSPIPVLLQPYDVVFVPNTPIDDVNIWVDKYMRQMIPFPFFTIGVQ